MTLSRYIALLLDELEGQERKIAGLYERIGGRIPEHAPFWTKMAKEELGHAEWMAGLRGKLALGHVVVNPDVLRLEELKKWGRKLDAWIARAGTEKWTMAEALAVALEIERGTLEMPFLTVFQGATPQAQALLDKFVEANARHVDELKRLAEKHP